MIKFVIVYKQTGKYYIGTDHNTWRDEVNHAKMFDSIVDANAEIIEKFADVKNASYVFEIHSVNLSSTIVNPEIDI